MPINANPAWAQDGSSVTFTAFNPINHVLGGTPHYWSARVAEPGAQPTVALVPLTPALADVIAVE